MDTADPFAPPPGSDLYYALLYVAKAQREQLAVINALKGELCAIPVSVSDVGVARVKLEWWRLEAERLIAGDPRHQLTRAYCDKFEVDSRLSHALNALVAGLNDELGGIDLSTREQQFNWFDSTFGLLYTLQSSVLAHDEDIATDHRHDLGRWIEIGYSLLNLKPLATRNLRRIPSESLAAAGCTWDNVSTASANVKFAAVVASECNLVIDGIAEILASTPTETRRQQQPLFTLAAIVQHTLIELREDGGRIWQHRIDLTPLRKLWLAWRLRYLQG